MHEDWIIPDWPAPERVRSVITTRAGGVSGGPYASLNLGFATEDEAANVTENRARLAALAPGEPKWLKQVHGARVVDADAVSGRPEADAAISRRSGTVCALLVADCLPILLADRAGSVVGAAHAGWRGLAAGVIDNTVASMLETGARAHELMAYIGPGIGPRAFEVGADVHDAYTRADSRAARHFASRGDGKWLADLPGLARLALERLGITAIFGGTLCTYSDPERFYSYRRERVTGRMAALIWLQP